MILGFKDRFVNPILKGTKIHTIREDSKNRWGRWSYIHFATGVRTSKYKCFKKDICWNTQKIEMTICPDSINIVNVDGKVLNVDEIKQLAYNDGFADIDDFFKWFNKDFKGKIIHWTPLIYQ